MFELRPFERRNNHVAAYDPWDQMERAFFGDGSWGRGLSEFKTDIQDKGDSYLLEADLPGFKKDEIHAQMENGYLTISASKGVDKDEKDKKGQYIRRERTFGQCARSFYVGEGVTEADVKAKYENGILELSIPKKEPQKVDNKKYIAIEG